MNLDKLITALVKSEIRNKLNYFTKDYINSIVEKVITKEVNKFLAANELQKQLTTKLNKELSISELVRNTEFRSITELRKSVQQYTQEQFKLETGEYFYNALVELLNKK